jgi:hypothetical protein
VRERDSIRKSEDAARRNFDELGIATVAMFPDHLHVGTELLVAQQAEIARAAMCEVVHTHAVASLEGVDIFADGFDRASDFVPGCDRQMRDRRNPGPIMRIGMANPARTDADQNVRRTDLRNFDFNILQWVADLH